MEKLDLKVGDKVVVVGNWSKSIKTVERITPKGAIRVNGTLYDEYGYQKGGDIWQRTSIFKATKEDVRKIKENDFIRETIREMKLVSNLTYEQAVEIRKILGE